MPRHAASPISVYRRIAVPLAIVAILMVVVATAMTLRHQSRPSTVGATQAWQQPTPAASRSDAPASAASKTEVSPASAPAQRIESSPGVDPAGDIAALTADLPAGGVSVDAVDLTTGASFSYGASGDMIMGSIAKLDILEVLLLQHEDTQTLLDDNDVSLATSMIENSDNDAADSLWSEVGSDSAFAAANPRLGVPNVVIGPDGQWGLGTTGASDQVTLLKNLTSTGGPLDAASRAFALGLLDDVEADQRWGVGVVADASTTFANKDGWLAVDNDADLWVTNSDGILTVDGQQVLMSVLTQHNQTENAGIALTESIAQAVAPALTHPTS